MATVWPIGHCIEISKCRRLCVAGYLPVAAEGCKLFELIAEEVQTEALITALNPTVAPDERVLVVGRCGGCNSTSNKS